MRTTAEKLFTPDDRERILLAVRHAEQKTAGEIVPFVVDASDHYEEAEWRFGALCGGVVASLCAAIHLLTDLWLPLDLWVVVVVILICFMGGMLVPRLFPAVRRVFAGGHTIAGRVARRATEAFVSEEVFRTRDRTGVLLFVSLLERKVLVLGDAGINAKVQPSEWQAVVDSVVEGILSRRPADGMVRAIGKIGALLERSGVAVKKDDRDELPDNLRLRDS